MIKHLSSLVAWMLGGFLALSGCTGFHQNADEVLVRDPNIGHYGDPLPAAEIAHHQWEFAALSENVYQEGLANVKLKKTKFERTLLYHSKGSIDQAEFEAACLDERRALPVTGWQQWKIPGDRFPSDVLQRRMLDEGMYMEVLERTGTPRTIAVVFEGTNFSDWKDWKANFRGLLRFIPFYKDQYTITATDLAREFYAAITKPNGLYRVNSSSFLLETEEGDPITLVTAGHSLGGGLAQHFAYAFKQPERGPYGLKVDDLFAFNSSPVTGWFSAEDPPRTYNVTGLRIHRIFEHGEILAYFRPFTNWLTTTRENPAIWGYRYNFDGNPGGIRNHSMRRLACGLIRAAAPWSTASAPLSEAPQEKQ